MIEMLRFAQQFDQQAIGAPGAKHKQNSKLDKAPTPKVELG